MRPLPLRPRIISALELAPMTTRRLTHVLSANYASVRHYVDELRGMRLIEPAWREKTRQKTTVTAWKLI